MRRLLAVLALVPALAACSAASAGPGPMSPPRKHAWTTYQPVGHVFTDGLEVLYLHGKRSAVIDKVKLLPGHDGDGLKLVGVRFAGPTRDGNVQLMPWPPRDPDLVASSVGPAIGRTIAPVTRGGAFNWELLLGIKVTKPGYLVRRGIEVDYHIGDQHYSYVIPAWLAVCTQVRYSHRNCPLPKASGFR